ncbi:MAG: hypothetical protein ACYC7A_00900 [Thermoanaerobaculia bacterium]
MDRKRREIGEGQAGCVFGLIILLIAVFIAYKMIPVKVKAAEMRQTVVDSSKSAGNLNDGQIMNRITSKAKDLELPVSEKNVKLNRAANKIKIEVEYVVPVEFPGYTYQWKFNHTAENPIF